MKGMEENALFPKHLHGYGITITVNGRTVNKQSLFDDLPHLVDADVTVERHQTLTDGVSLRHPELLVSSQRRRVEHPRAEVVVRLGGRAV